MQSHPREAQSTRTVVMVRPARFAANPQTLASNAFQAAGAAASEHAAIAEFDGVVAALRAARIEVRSIDDTAEPHKPDALFPNNWFSTHADGTVVLYPMCAPNRRAERRLDLFEMLRHDGFVCHRLVDLSTHELDGRFLEGTGSLVLDRPRRVAYACRSPRTDPQLLEVWAAELGYRVVAFDATDSAGRAIYHTNVMLCVGSGWALACLDAIRDPGQRAALVAELRFGGRELIEIDLAQLAGFAGNMLELAAPDGPLVALSDRAAQTLRTEQRAALARHARLVAVPVPTIETAGGGGVRCMLGEVFLPRAEGRSDG